MQTRDDKYISQLEDTRTLRIRQNHWKNIQNLLFSQDEETDRKHKKNATYALKRSTININFMNYSRV